MRQPPSFPMLYSCLGPLLSASCIPYMSGDCESSRQCLKACGVSWGLGSTLESFRMIHPWLEKIKNSWLTYKQSRKDPNASPLLSLELSTLFASGPIWNKNWCLLPHNIHVHAGSAVRLQCNVPRVVSKAL